MDPNPNQPSYQPPNQPEPQPAPPQNNIPEQPYSAQPQPFQSQPQAYGQPVQPQPSQHVENPGQTFGIISIVMPFVGLSVVGIILGVISRNKSKRANQPATLGTIGMILSIVVTVIVFAVTLFISITAYNGIQQLAKQQEDLSNSSSPSGGSSGSSSSSSSLTSDTAEIQKRAEAYYVITGDYPQFKSDFSKHAESTVDPSVEFNTMLVTNRRVSYIYCGEGAAQILYFKNTAKELAITPLGTASSTESCVKIS